MSKTPERQAIEFLQRKQREAIDRMDEYQLYRFAIDALEEKERRISGGLSLALGTEVRIRTDLVVGELYDGVSFEEEMKPYLGKEAVIRAYNHEDDVAPSYALNVDENFWSWSDGMLEKRNPSMQADVFGTETHTQHQRANNRRIAIGDLSAGTKKALAEALEKRRKE